MKILWVGNLPGRIGGQNRVAFCTIRELIKLGYQIECAGRGTQVVDTDDTIPCRCVEFNEHDPEKLYRHIDEFKPAIILFSHDIWLYYFLPELKQKYPHIKLIGWLTIDAHPIHASWFGLLRTFDYVCTSTRFGKDTIYARWPERMVEVVEYGVDHSIYNLSV